LRRIAADLNSLIEALSAHSAGCRFGLAIVASSRLFDPTDGSAREGSIRFPKELAPKTSLEKNRGRIETCTNTGSRTSIGS
jgi:hypothetical protein